MAADAGSVGANAIYIWSFLAESAQAARFFCTISNAKPEGLRPYRYNVDGIERRPPGRRGQTAFCVAQYTTWLRSGRKSKTF